MAGFNPVRAALSQALSTPKVKTTAPKLRIKGTSGRIHTTAGVSLGKLTTLGGGAYSLRKFGL